jgi:hypothetical protein
MVKVEWQPYGRGNSFGHAPFELNPKCMAENECWYECQLLSITCHSGLWGVRVFQEHPAKYKDTDHMLFRNNSIYSIPPLRCIFRVYWHCVLFIYSYDMIKHKKTYWNNIFWQAREEVWKYVMEAKKRKTNSNGASFWCCFQQLPLLVSTEHSCAASSRCLFGGHFGRTLGFWLIVNWYFLFNKWPCASSWCRGRASF